MAPAASKTPRLIQATLIFMVVVIVISLTALFVVGKFLGRLNPIDSLPFLYKGH